MQAQGPAWTEACLHIWGEASGEKHPAEICMQVVHRTMYEGVFVGPGRPRIQVVPGKEGAGSWTQHGALKEEPFQSFEHLDLSSNSTSFSWWTGAITFLRLILVL